ncbi:MFS transporter [Marinimicrobium sp. ABcell2]|uniref:MFS transporter n=1 Tax=Marinimicrobium sp. ABcell2 TaxID=3069751 RepID=UPI0027AF5EFA|nr:MFS transporter [Marinimicrobium sp. ABcell2]MDQ2077686.1 MFS transporter [Marinimicrobium sp. ABcell2]
MADAAKEEDVKQFGLMRERRFLPFFITQFGGAYNDNFYRSALLVLFTYTDIHLMGLSVDVTNNLVAATLIIPFLLFAPLAGQYADKFEKSSFIRSIKVAEIMIMLLAALALWLNSATLLLLVVFLTGTQSACFSPLKYAILPQHMHKRELVGANGLVHSGTSLAILLGMIGGSLAMAFAPGRWLVAGGGLLIALIGWRASVYIPRAEPADADITLKLNPYSQGMRSIGYARENAMVFWSIIGGSWYWFLGTFYLTQLPNFTRSTLFGEAQVISVLLAVFIVGIGIGALLCERLSRRQVEPGVAPLGALLVLVFGVDLAFAGLSFAATHAPSDSDQLYSIAELFAMPHWWRVAFDVTFLGVGGSLYMVPLFALMQNRSRPERRAQIIGANNVLNSLFMIGAALTGMVGLGVIGLSIPQLFLVVMGLHVLVCVGIFFRMREFWERFRRRFLPGGG